MRLWRRTMPPRFHSTVVNMLREKKKTDSIYEQLIASGVVNLKRHRKTKEEVLEYIELIQKSL